NNDSRVGTTPPSRNIVFICSGAVNVLIAATDASMFLDAVLMPQPQPPSVAALLAAFIFGTSATPTLPITFEPLACDCVQTKFQLIVKMALPSVKIWRASP